MPPTIKITLKGLLVIFVKPNKKECVVGFLLETPPDHEFKITINKVLAGGNVETREIRRKDIKDRLTLEVKNKEGICLRKEAATIERPKGPTPENKDSFLWMVDFERDIHKKKVGAKKEGFVAILTLNNGELFTSRVSENQLIISEKPSDSGRIFGFVACEMGIDIVLDQPDSSAVFKNGHKNEFESDSQSSYEIIFDRGPLPSDHSRHKHDADYYYTALGDLIPGERKYFSSTNPAVKATPDAACFTGGGGSSSP